MMKSYNKPSFNFYFRHMPTVKPDTIGWIVQSAIDQIIRDDVKELADDLTREAEKFRSEGNRADGALADKLEDAALALDDFVGVGE